MVNAVNREIAQGRQLTLDHGQPRSAGSGFMDPDNLPDDAVLPKDIAREMSITPVAIHGWINKGRMQEIGRLGGTLGAADCQATCK